MTAVAVMLVLCSAVMHASWNLLAKRASAAEVFTVLMAAAAVLIFTPVAVYLAVTEPPDAAGWAFVGGTILLHTGYFTLLGAAYKNGDLSVVYPVARGAGIALVPTVAYFALGESLSWQAACGVALIVAGIFLVAGFAGGDGARRRWVGPGVIYALLTGAMICGYSVVDKQGVQHVSPLLYVTLLTAGGGLGMFLIVRKRYAAALWRDEIRTNWRSVAAAGFLQTAAYALVLAALRLSPVSYVAPFREVGVVVGVALGAVVLKERVTRVRVVAACTVAVGALVVALAP